MPPYLPRTAAAFLILGLSTAPALAGPGFAYSWVASEKSFDDCIVAAQSVIMDKNYPIMALSGFGVVGQTMDDTLYINCEDKRHVSLVLMRAGDVSADEINSVAAELQKKLK